MIEKDDFKERAIDLLDKYFPKQEKGEKEKQGKNGRGEAMVLVSELILVKEEIINALYVRRTDTKEDEGGNVGDGGVSHMPSSGVPVRSRMPGQIRRRGNLSNGSTRVTNAGKG
jgi:hypothetical protein